MIEEGLLDAAGAGRPAADRRLRDPHQTPLSGPASPPKPGPMLAAADVIRITVRGRGGHASMPHLALDPIPIAAEIVLALQSMVTRRIDVFDPAVVTIGQISGGTTNNIIPETAFLLGTIRTVSAQTRATVRDGIRRVAEGIAAAHGATADVDLEPGYPVTINDAGFTAFVRSIAAELIGEDQVVDMQAPVMGAEDFSYVLEHVPGAMAFLGARPAGVDPATAPQNHSNLVVFDEACRRRRALRRGRDPAPPAAEIASRGRARHAPIPIADRDRPITAAVRERFADRLPRAGSGRPLPASPDPPTPGEWTPPRSSAT